MFGVVPLTPVDRDDRGFIQKDLFRLGHQFHTFLLISGFLGLGYEFVISGIRPAHVIVRAISNPKIEETHGVVVISTPTCEDKIKIMISHLLQSCFEVDIFQH